MQKATSVTIAVAPAAVAEDGATNLVYTLTRDVTTGPLTVSFTVGGHAVLETDYTQAGAATFTAAAGTVTFADGAATATVTIDPTPDSMVEAAETVSLTLSAGDSYLVGTSNTATGTITDDDTATFTIDDVTVNEATGAATFTVSVDHPLDIDVTIDVNYLAGTAVAADFDGATGTVTFTAGSTIAQTVAVAITDDDIVELTETFTVSLAVSAATVVGTRTVVVSDTAIGTITDNDVAGTPGDVDGDTDFDANDAFLIQLVQLAGSNTQIDQSKGASSLAAAEIRANITAIGLAGDVDGDNDFDANDSFLIQLVKLAGSDTQIDQSKGASPLSAVQIRAKVDGLGGGNSGQQATASASPRLAAVSAESEQRQAGLFESLPTSPSNAEYLIPAADVVQIDEIWGDNRSWIDAL